MEVKIADLNQNERLVLLALATITNEDFYTSFAGIQGNIDVDIEIKDIRKACRSLREMGLVSYMCGLTDEDGKVAGSGYQCTKKGRSFLLGSI